MKKIFLFLLLIFISTNISAQIFAPIGAKWTYNRATCIGPYCTINPIIFEAVSDTLINSINCRHITVTTAWTCCCMDVPECYVYDSAGIVYRYDFDMEKFIVLYDFNVTAGGSWWVYSPSVSDSDLVTIDSTSVILINGVQRKILYGAAKEDPRKLDFWGPFIEGIGSMVALFPKFALCDDYYGGLRCYGDSIVGLHEFQITPHCDSTFTTGINDLNLPENMKLFPNPSSGVFSLHFQNGEALQRIEVFNYLGKGILQKQGQLNEIDLSAFASGIYFYSIITKSGSTFQGKIVKE